MRLKTILIILYIITIMLFLSLIELQVRMHHEQELEEAKHMVAQPCKPILYIIDGNNIIEDTEYIYYEIGVTE